MTHTDEHLSFESAVALHLNGDLSGAEAAYRQLLADDQSHPEAANNLGLICLATDRVSEAMDWFNQAITVLPTFADAHNNLGLTLARQHQVHQAILRYQIAIAHQPAHASAYNNLGLAQQSLGQLSQAQTSFETSLRLNPNQADAANNLGNLMKEQGRIEEAVRFFQQAIRLNPSFAAAYNNLGVVLKEKDQNALAVDYYVRALQLQPHNPEVYNNLGVALYDMGNVDQAVQSFRKAFQLRAQLIRVSDPVRALCQMLIELKNIPVIYERTEDIAACRQRFEQHLDAALTLSRELLPVTPDEKQMILEILFKINNFYLSYQQQNDLPLQVKYADLLRTILRDEIAAFTPKTSRPTGGRIRLGVASGVLKNYNASNWSYDWLANLPPADYEFFAYSLNGPIDTLTNRFGALGHYRWLPFTEKDFLKALTVIRDDELDILLLPDVGITAVSKIISVFRLAPFQCTGWGHPMTTGSPAVDAYLSSALMEADDAAPHYTEQLVLLPNLGLFFNEPQPTATVSPSSFDLPTDRVIFGSVQSLFKYLPQDDYLYPAIAKQVPEAFFVFLSYNHAPVTDIFSRRLHRAFAAYGLDADHYVRVLPRMPHSRFQELLTVVRVNLDTLGWNGGNTTFFSLSMNCPVVTLPGNYMRGRHSCAMLELIGVPELIATSPEHYIELAARLATDNDFRTRMVSRIEQGKHRLYRDVDCIHALDTCFKTARP